ncbi:MAG TPA: anhydro-N-acetylmuramic acid kinase [Abditibacteriaceae bacterium]|jgi:anhydro-N-acetylmuramic acid kinase
MKVIGLMSGTSLDGIDAALCEVEGSGETLRAQLLHFCTVPFESDLRARILELCSSDTASLEAIARLNIELGEVFANAALEVLRRAKANPVDIACIASHGQTIGHWPPQNGKRGTTWQIGDAATVAALTGIDIVSNFRAADMAAGGQGAPLVPYADWCVLRDGKTHRIAQNIGGIANATWLPAGGNLNDVRAWDSGPGVMLIDALMRTLQNKSCDFDGVLAAQGTVCETLLQETLAHPFFALASPKSCGRAEFGEACASQFLIRARTLNLSDADVLTTATMLSARSMAHSYKRSASEIFVLPAPIEIVLGGGGARNTTLVQMLRDELHSGLEIGGARVLPVIKHFHDFGIDGDAREALAFAVLAAETLRGVPNTVPAATGATRAVCSGSLTRA